VKRHKSTRLYKEEEEKNRNAFLLIIIK